MMRRLLIIGIFLLLGAVVNVAVAWGCALWSEYRIAPDRCLSHLDSPRWIASVCEGPGVTRVSGVPDNGEWGPEEMYRDDVLPSWSRTTDRPPRDEFNDPSLPWTIELAYGWPARSGVGIIRKHVRGAAVWAVTSGIRTADDGSGEPVSYRVLPVRPIWSGFAINTLFYAAILWLLIPGPVVLRRFLRLRWGLCPNCAYPMGESSVCTECGRALPSST